MFRDAPTGHIFLHQYLFSLKLNRTAITGIGHNSTMIGIILPVIVVIALRWNIPLVTIPIGQILQNIGNLKIVEPTRAETNTPLATLEL